MKATVPKASFTHRYWFQNCSVPGPYVVPAQDNNRHGRVAA